MKYRPAARPPANHSKDEKMKVNLFPGFNRKRPKQTDLGALEARNPLVAGVTAKCLSPDRVTNNGTPSTTQVDSWQAWYEELKARDTQGEQLTLDELRECFKECPQTIKLDEADHLLTLMRKHAK